MSFPSREISETLNQDVPSEFELDVQNKLLTVKDLFIKDAFLVFRALCKLTMKPVSTER
jgi:brefeldin A-inhibited guanine nucleotide-exchange protein